MKTRPTHDTKETPKHSRLCRTRGLLPAVEFWAHREVLSITCQLWVTHFQWHACANKLTYISKSNIFNKVTTCDFRLWIIVLHIAKYFSETEDRGIRLLGVIYQNLNIYLLLLSVIGTLTVPSCARRLFALVGLGKKRELRYLSERTSTNILYWSAVAKARGSCFSLTQPECWCSGGFLGGILRGSLFSQSGPSSHYWSIG